MGRAICWEDEEVQEVQEQEEEEEDHRQQLAEGVAVRFLRSRKVTAYP